VAPLALLDVTQATGVVMRDEQETRTHHPPPIASPTLDRNALRLAMRQQRKAVPQLVRHAVAHSIAWHLSRSRLLAKGQRVAVYAAFDGEIDLTSVVRQAQRIRCTLYAPRIVNMRARRMEFIKLLKDSGNKRNRHAILEPRTNLEQRINPRLLDVVLLPVLAFDVQGWRLGFGAGFYDRKFAFRRRAFKRKPLLIGIGYEFQRVTPQTPSPWDVLLDAVVTERGIRRCYPPQLTKK